MILELLALTGAIASTTQIAPNETNINWFKSYEIGDLEDTTFDFNYGNMNYTGEWCNTIIAENKLQNGNNTITTNISYNENSLIFNQDYTYLPIYVGYSINGVEYLDFYLTQDSLNTFVINTSDNFDSNYNCYFVYKFPTLLDINHENVIVENDLLFYSDIAYYGNLYGNEQYINGYNAGYKEGYTQGNFDGIDTTQRYYTRGNEGYTSIYQIGYNDGYSNGYDIGSDSDTNLGNLMLIIATTPFETFKTIWSFDILGFNMATFVLGLLTLGIVLIIWKKIR